MEANKNLTHQHSTNTNLPELSIPKECVHNYMCIPPPRLSELSQAESFIGMSSAYRLQLLLSLWVETIPKSSQAWIQPHLVTLYNHCSLTLLVLANFPSLRWCHWRCLDFSVRCHSISNLQTQLKAQDSVAIPTHNECSLLWSLKSHGSFFWIWCTLSAISNCTFPSLGF